MLSLWETTKLFFTISPPVCIPESSVWLFLCIFSSTWDHQVFLCSLKQKGMTINRYSAVPHFFFSLSFIYFYFYFILFLERERKGEREGEKQQCVIASCTCPSGDLACNPGMCPDWESNQQLFGLQAGTQSTEPHQLGPFICIYYESIPHIQSLLSSA